MPQRRSTGDRDAALGAIRKAMIEKKLTQAELADAADCHEKTIQNLLGGRSVRDQTLFDVCMVLGLNFEALRPGWSQSGHAATQAQEPMDLQGAGGLVAPVYMGAYTRAAVDHYIGRYLTLRPAFSLPDTIVAYETNIVWDPHWPSLLFEESGRPDATYSHRGRLYIPASSMFIHLVSLTKGAMRMVLVSQLDRLGAMRGLITTLNKQGAMLVPVSCPIVYLKRDEIDADGLGNIEPQHEDYASYRRVLDETIADGYAKVVSL
ncbi:MAG: helix-turn-helix domain-containing protein [Hyphomicrobiaceae bacterium]